MPIVQCLSHAYGGRHQAYGHPNLLRLVESIVLSEDVLHR